MPVSTTASSTQSRPSATLRTRKATSPSFVNLQALLKRLSRICLSRMESALSAPRFSWASTMRRFRFFSASCPAVPMTSSIRRAKLTDSRLSSSLPASIFERSSTSLMRPRRWLPARCTRCSGSCAFSVPKRAALLTIISVKPMMALSGVRSSWLMLARNCDLRSLASASCLLLSWISSNSRTFSMAITAWSAKVATNSICLSVNGRTTVRSVASVLAVVSNAALAENPNLGRIAAPEEIASWDISIGPDGAGLPPGSGTPKQGEAVYTEKCLVCHGEKGAGKPNDVLVGGRGTLAGDQPSVKTVGSFWPYATTLFDYVRRAMPLNESKSLTNDEVYAVIAYLLQLNGIIGENETINAQTLPRVQMPNRDGFMTFSRGK